MPYKDPARKREWQRQWKAQRRADWFRGKSCVDCGVKDNLELDHVDPTQKVDHKIWSWSEPRRQVELAKCVPRCVPCHRRKSLSELPRTAHGRCWCYIKYKCRCDLCRAWKRQSDAKYRKRKGPEVS